MTTNVMIDLETLGTSPGCALLSIGAVVFSPGGLGEEFYQEIDYRRLYGLNVDPATLMWWHNQPPILRDRLFTPNRSKKLLPDALVDLSAWLAEVTEDPTDIGIWGNGADFDNAILQVAYAHTGLNPAWKFWQNRCYRTLKNLAPQIELERIGEHHNALDDAKSQAVHAITLLKHLVGGGS